MSIANLVVLNERVLIAPCGEMKTESGIVIPQNLKVDKKQQVSCGYVVKVGNGYPIFNNMDTDKAWENSNRTLVTFMPLQVKEKDFVFYLSEHAVEILYEQKKYDIIPEFLVLMIDRNIKNQIRDLIGE